MKILYFDELASTQTYLKKLLSEKKIQQNTAIVAKHQTAGIGSRENVWKGLEGNLFLSFCIDIKDLPDDLPLESASIYFAYLLKELLSAYGSCVWIKWPNDFYLENLKIGGMITSIIGDFLVCGVGLNLLYAPDGHGVLDITLSKDNLVKNYLGKVEKKILWKQVFSKYKLEFPKNKEFYTHNNGRKISLEKAILEDDGSLFINGERIYSLR